MTTAPDKLSAADQDLIEFFNLYVKMLGEQLDGMRIDLTTAFDEVMAQLTEIDRSQSEARNLAETWLESVYLSPDQNADNAIRRRQSRVDEVIENGVKGVASTTSSTDLAGSGISDLHKIDQKLNDAVCQLMGALSADDVTAQKLQHIEIVVKKTKTHLQELIRMPVRNYSQSEIDKFKADLMHTAATAYSTTSEHQIFKKYFPIVRKKTA